MKLTIFRRVPAVGFAALLITVALAPRLRADRVVFLEAVSSWEYRPGTAEASSPDPASWRLGEPAEGWSSGTAPLGYGRSFVAGTDLASLDPPMRANYSSVFLRGEFEVADRDAIVELHALVQYDDAVIVWINGREVLRDGVDGEPGSFVAHDATANRSHSATEAEDFLLPDAGAYVLSGRNVIAAQVFNRSLSNSDLYFDMELVDPLGPDLQPPRVEQISPRPETTVRRLESVEVTFNEEVVGVDATDLLVNGAPARSLSGSGAGPYRFEFEAPPVGEVVFSWSGAQDIVDLAPARNAFGGGSFRYNFDPDAPPPHVVISEILAANGRGLEDEDRETEDWIEILNASDEVVDLGGWSLTDDPDEPDLWIFPERILGPGERLIVFASAKDRVEGAELHTNFKLNDGGEYLGLYNSEVPRSAIFEFRPEYPPQRFDHSYGLSAGDAFVYFAEPTPGEPNSDEGIAGGFVLDPRLSVPHGIYSETFSLELATPTPGATIYYTLNGSVPSPENGETYSGPIPIAPSGGRGVARVRAAGYRQGLLPSRVVTASYVFPESVIQQPAFPDGVPRTWPGTTADYGVDSRVINADPGLAVTALLSIPTLSIVTDDDTLFSATTGVYSHPAASGPAQERGVSAELIRTDGREGFQINCGLRTQGGSSTSNWKSKKVSLRLLFKGDYGATTLRYPLYTGYDVSSFNTLVVDASLNLVWNHPDSGQQSRAQYIRDQFVADLQNEAGGHAPRAIFVHVYLNGMYWGQYYLHERPDAFWAAENFGGDRTEYDALRHNQSNVVDGDSRAYLQMLTLARASQSDPANYQALGEMLDLTEFADYMLINFYVGNTDWAHQNWYATRKRVDGYRWRYHSWDAEHVLKSPTENVVSKNDSGGPTEILTRLRANPEFRMLFADRVQRHFFDGGMLYVNPDSPDWNDDAPQNNRPASIYDRRAREVGVSILMESARWGDVNRPASPYTREDWQRELSWLQRSYFPLRSRNVLAQFRSVNLFPGLAAPEFSRHGGEIQPGFSLSMSLPAGTEGTIYYTTDGSDPRLPGGGISGSAGTYTDGAAVSLNAFTVVKARTWNDDSWSALNESTFRLAGSSPEVLVISELMYNPDGGPWFEFVELHNPSDVAVDISGLRFTNGILYRFDAGETLGAGEYLVLVSSAGAFEARYPGVRFRGVFVGQLDNGGERITLSTAEGRELFSVQYNDRRSWPVAADGFGRSLVLAAEDATDLDDPRSWRSSAELGGSPGREDPEPSYRGVVISEVQPVSSAGRRDDFVELENLGAEAVDVGGWYLGTSRASVDGLLRYRIPASQVIPSGKFLVIGGDEYEFLLDRVRGAAYLSAVDEENASIAYSSGVEFDAGEAGLSFGRHETTTALEFSPMEAATPGESNSLPQSPQVAIGEIQYHPLDGESEFIELHNPGSVSVDLSGWSLEGLSDLTGRDGYTFAAGTSLPAGAYLVLVPGDPETFRAVAGVPPAAAVLGPYGGALDNGGERLRLLRPSADVEAGGRVLVDMVRFDDREPWPAGTDGKGFSLERIDASVYGNEVLNWAASAEIGGTPGARNSAADDTGAGGMQRPGDIDQNARLNIADVILLLRHLFQGRPATLPCEGGTIADSGNRTLLDANGDLLVDASDAVHLMVYLFGEGPDHHLGRRCVRIAGCPEVCSR